MHNWFWDALVNKVGIVKAYWNVEADANEEEYFDLSQDELAMLMQEDSIEIVEQEEIAGEPLPVGIDPVTGEPLLQAPPSTYNVRLKKTVDASRVKIENVSTAEFMIDRHSDTIEDARFVAQRKMLTRAELVAMGYDKNVVAELTTDDNVGLGEDGFEFNPINDVNNTDPSQDLIAYYECYIRHR